MDYENYTLVELRQMAKEIGVKNLSKLKKDELIEILNNNNGYNEDNNNDESNT